MNLNLITDKINAIIIATDNVQHTLEILPDYGCRAFFQQPSDWAGYTDLFVAGTRDEMLTLVDAIWPRWGCVPVTITSVGMD